VSTALGLGLIAHLLLLLGLAHLLRPLPVLLLAAGVHALGRPAWRELGGDLRALRPGWRWGIGALALAPLALLALYPPTAFDATLYHLPFARAFVESGAVPYLLDRRVPVFPQVNEVLFAAVMMLGRDVAAHGVQLLMTVLSAALALEWGRRGFPERPWVGAWVGWTAAALFLGNPIAVYLAGTAYIEAGLTLFVTAGLYTLDRWRAGGGRGWLVLSAALLATACDVKYLGLFFAGIAGLGVLLAGGRGRPLAARARDGLLFGAVCLALLAPWYLRMVAFSGNPLFPYLPRVFGSTPWSSAEVPAEQQPHGGHLAHWLRLPWDLVFRRDLYNRQPPFSPFYLAAVPLLLLGAARDRRIGTALLLVGLYTFVFTFLPPDGRYLEPVLPLASLAAAAALATALGRRSPGRRTLAALCLLLFLPGWLYAGYRIRKQGPLPVTAAQREGYLARSLPFYPAVAWLNRTRGSAYTVWALHAERLAYLADGRYLGEWFGPASFARVLAGVRSPGELYGRLRGLGAGYLLVTEEGGLPFPEDDAFRRWFTPVYSDPQARVYALAPAPPT
jgi:4-amino-4-deoxy-L-arabinose transferase-like glycosyltransferase